MPILGDCENRKETGIVSKMHPNKTETILNEVTETRNAVRNAEFLQFPLFQA